MCFTRLSHLVHILLFLFAFYSDSLYSNAVAFSSASNSSEEIKNIFSTTDLSKYNYKSITKGVVKNGNYAEGGLINTGALSSLTNTAGNSSSRGQNESLSTPDSNTPKHSQNISVPLHISVKAKEDVLSETLLKPLTHFKLNETENNLFLGAPEVVHFNGTSSVKPRKGVYYNKIVPRKGVDNDNETNYTSLNSTPCVWVIEDDCYKAVDFNKKNCTCCKNSNQLGKLIQQESKISCDSCKKSHNLPLGDKNSCLNVCCKSKSLDKESHLLVVKEKVLSKSFVKNDNKNKTVTVIEKAEKLSQNHTVEEVFLNLTNSFSKKLKLKPSVTKVPYDAEIVTDLLGKAKKDVFIPVVVSILLVPILGILLFFIWRRSKDYWDKRYYRKMDFLIDGMYND